jgi:hypothetical protein
MADTDRAGMAGRAEPEMAEGAEPDAAGRAEPGVLRWLRGVAAFWYDFIVGDDWVVAVGVVAGLAITYALSKTALAAWWLMPLAIVVLLPLSLWRAVRRR